jgi:predicted DNA-binding protein (MmcQ/YjbR family)
MWAVRRQGAMARPLRRKAPEENAAFERVRAFCLALPGTVETSPWGHPNFKVQKKAFVTLELHEGRPCIAIRLVADQVQALCAEADFFSTPYGKGLWVSIYSDRRINWRHIEQLITQSHDALASDVKIKKPGAKRLKSPRPVA